MTTTAPPARALVCASQVDALQELRRLLGRGGWEADSHLVGAPDPEALGGVRLVVVEGGRAPAEADSVSSAGARPR